MWCFKNKAGHFLFIIKKEINNSVQDSSANKWFNFNKKSNIIGNKNSLEYIFQDISIETMFEAGTIHGMLFCFDEKYIDNIIKKVKSKLDVDVKAYKIEFIEYE